MNDELRDAILALQDGDSTTFRNVVKDTLISKAMDEIESRRVTAGQLVFADDTEGESSDEDI